MKALLLAMASVVLFASPAVAQTVPEPLPTPSISPLPPPPVQVNIDLPKEDPGALDCSWYRPSTWFRGCMEPKKKEWRSKAQENIQKSLTLVAKMVVSPSPFDSARVRELWLKVASPIALAIVALLFTWAAGRGTIGDPQYMRPGELVGRAGIALGAGAAAIFVIPWLIGFANEIALMMGFADVVKDTDLTMFGDQMFISTIAVLLLIPMAFLELVFLIFRWVLLTLWCIVSPDAAALYTYPGTEQVCLTYCKGLGAMIGAPIVEMLLISVMVWIVNTGHGVWGADVGGWVDVVLLLSLFAALIVFNLWIFKTVFGIGNYSSLRNALRSGRHRAAGWASAPERGF